MTVEEAFLAGLAAVKAAGLKAKGTDIPVIAARNVFNKACFGKDTDPRFDEQGPQYAYKTILQAYAAAVK